MVSGFNVLDELAEWTGRKEIAVERFGERPKQFTWPRMPFVIIEEPAPAGLPKEFGMTCSAPGTDFADRYAPLESDALLADFLAIADAGDTAVSEVRTFASRYGLHRIKPRWPFTSSFPTVGEVLYEVRKAATVAVAHSSLSGAQSGGERRAVIDQIEAFDGEKMKIIAAISPEVASPFTKAISDSIRTRRSQLKISGAYEIVINFWIEHMVNGELSRQDVVTGLQVTSGAMGSFQPTYFPGSLLGAIWVQLASELIRGGTTRRCKRSDCAKVFFTESHTSKKEYCSVKCRDKVNNHAKYIERKKRRKLEQGSSI